MQFSQKCRGTITSSAATTILLVTPSFCHLCLDRPGWIYTQRQNSLNHPLRNCPRFSKLLQNQPTGSQNLMSETPGCKHCVRVAIRKYPSSMKEDPDTHSCTLDQELLEQGRQDPFHLACKTCFTQSFPCKNKTPLGIIKKDTSIHCKIGCLGSSKNTC